MTYAWSPLFILQYFLLICHAAPEGFQPFPGERGGRFRKARSTAPTTTPPFESVSLGTASSSPLSTGATPSITLSNNYTGLSIGIPRVTATSSSPALNLSGIANNTAANTVQGSSIAVTSTSSPSNSLQDTTPTGFNGSNVSSSITISSPTARNNSTFGGNLPNATITAAPISTTSSFPVGSGVLPFGSNSKVNATVSFRGASTTSNASASSIFLAATNSTTSVSLNFTGSHPIASLTAANSSSTIIATNSSSLVIPSPTLNPVNGSTTASSSGASIGNNSTTSSTASPSITIPGGSSSSSGSLTGSSSSSSSAAGGSLGSGGPGGLPIPGGLPGGPGGLPGFPGGGGGDGGDGGDSSNNKNPSPSVSGPSQSSPSSPSSSPTSSGSSSSSSMSITSSSSSSSSSASSSTTSRTNSTSIVSSSTVSSSMNSSSTSTSSASGAYCSVGACNGPQCGASPVPAVKREVLLTEGRLPTPQDFLRRDLAERNESSQHDAIDEHYRFKRGVIDLPTDDEFPDIDNFITEVMSFPGAKECPIPTMNPISTAITVRFDSPPDNGNYYPSLVGLEGCTSVVIIGENGCWISHFWEAPWFLGFGAYEGGDAAFKTAVITPLENGANFMPSPFAAGGQSSRIPELGPGPTGFQPEIHILTREDNGAITYPAQVDLIQKALTGPSRAFAGVPVAITGYVRQNPNPTKAKGKVLIQYTNDQLDKEEEQPLCPQGAIYKFWFEENLISQHTWPAFGDQLAVPNAKSKIRRTQVCRSNSTSTALASSGSIVPPNPTLSGQISGSHTGPYATLNPAASFTTIVTPVAPTPDIVLASSGSFVPGLRPTGVSHIQYQTNSVPQNPGNSAPQNPGPTPSVLITSPDELY